MSENCIFCKIIQGEIPCSRIYEDDSILSFLDINPWSPGHCLVIPKVHYQRLEECPQELIASMAGKLGTIAKAVITAVGARGYNVLNNNGSEAGQEVEHVHFHIIPRKSGDRIIRHTPQGKYPEGEINRLADKISNILP